MSKDLTPIELLLISAICFILGFVIFFQRDTEPQLIGITAPAIGDLLIGAASNGGYTRLVKPSGNATAHDYVLSMNTSGAAQWSNTLDGGSF